MPLFQNKITIFCRFFRKIGIFLALASTAPCMAQLKDVDNTILFMSANSVWNHNDYELKDSFKDTCKSFYDAYSFSVDMNDDETASKINSWISENTKGLLNDIFKPGQTRNHVLMTINTIYFKGLWKEIFDRTKTKQELFRNLDGREVWVDMMKGTQYSRYYFGEDYSVASIAYGNEAYSLYIILPKDKEKLNDLCKNISHDEWRSIKDNTTASNVMWNLPRFEFKGNTINYTDYLKDCGITRMFEVGLNDVFIKGYETGASIFQTVYVKVDEDGTEGAAETHTGITTGTYATPEMIVDKPFLFIIEEQSSGSILFMGKITEL